MSQQNVNTAAQSTQESSEEKLKLRKPRAKKPVPAAISAVLEKTDIIYVPLSRLKKSPKNVRKIAYSQNSIEKLANNILKVGLLHNLIVHLMPDGTYGVAGGGRRTAALMYLVSEMFYQPDQLIPVKCVPEELALAASFAENSDRCEMHPAEQVEAFRAMADEGKSAAQIGDIMGFSTRHVNRCLRLSELSPAILSELAEDRISLEQCQALALTDSHQRQVDIWQQANTQYSNPSADLLRRMITSEEVKISSEPKFGFVGKDAYIAAGGVIRIDLFSNEDEGYIDPVLVEKLALEKLKGIADALQQAEGWAWSEARTIKLWKYDSAVKKEFHFIDEPEVTFTEEEKKALTELSQQSAASQNPEQMNELENRIHDINEDAVSRSWEGVDKTKAGIIVSFWRSEISIQRGIMRRIDLPEKERPAVNADSKAVLDTFSAALVKSMSCERTLSVQAALSVKPTISVALLTWHLCLSVFGELTRGADHLKITLHNNQPVLKDFAASGENGKAWLFLMEQKAQWEKRLPEKWVADFHWLLKWSDEDVNALLGFCSAHAVCGIQERVYGSSDITPLTSLEEAMEFELHEWWKPDAEGFFKRISKQQIVNLLNEAGATGKAQDASKVSRADAAYIAESALVHTTWVPDWMKTPNRQQTGGQDKNTMDVTG